MPLPDEFDGLLTTGRPSSKRIWLGAGLTLLVAVVLVAWLAIPFVNSDKKRPREIERRDDGVVVEWSPLQAPRAGVTSVPDELLTYPYAYPPDVSGTGTCNDPRFRIEEMPPFGHVYTDDEQLVVPIRYDAPNCSQAVIAYLGRHVEGSTRYNLQCDAGLVSDCEDLRSWFFTDPVELSASEGVLRAQGIATDSSTVTVDSAPNLDGFVLCAVTVSVGDPSENGTHASQTIELGCPYADPTGSFIADP